MSGYSLVLSDELLKIYFDDKIEIMLSSGFDNLFLTNKDLTCLVRYLKTNYNKK